MCCWVHIKEDRVQNDGAGIGAAFETDNETASEPVVGVFAKYGISYQTAGTGKLLRQQP